MSPSVKAGISQGCVITKIDDTEVTSQATITNYVSTKKPGDEVTLEVYNGLTGKTFTATVTLSESSGTERCSPLKRLQDLFHKFFLNNPRGGAPDGVPPFGLPG